MTKPKMTHEYKPAPKRKKPEPNLADCCETAPVPACHDFPRPRESLDYVAPTMKPPARERRKRPRDDEASDAESVGVPEADFCIELPANSTLNREATLAARRRFTQPWFDLAGRRMVVWDNDLEQWVPDWDALWSVLGRFVESAHAAEAWAKTSFAPGAFPATQDAVDALVYADLPDPLERTLGRSARIPTGPDITPMPGEAACAACFDVADEADVCDGWCAACRTLGRTGELVGDMVLKGRAAALAERAARIDATRGPLQAERRRALIKHVVTEFVSRRDMNTPNVGAWWTTRTPGWAATALNLAKGKTLSWVDNRKAALEEWNRAFPLKVIVFKRDKFKTPLDVDFTGVK